MFIYIEYQKKNLLFSTATRVVVFILSFSLIFGPSAGYAQSMINLPKPGAMISLSPIYVPTLIKGIKFFPNNPLQFDFIIDTGHSKLKDDDLKQESTKLIKYFMASLTIPEDNLWVNLSPYEADRIAPNDLGQTGMGRDLLAQDYLLKQITASLMYPEEELGKRFWNKIYEKANRLYGTSEIPMNTFNKVWIIPDKATVYVNGDTVFVTDSHLKVMLEEDYLALEHNLLNSPIGTDELKKDDAKQINDVSSAIVREIIIPELEAEVNNGKNFSNLRQIYHSMILATWYKQNLKESFLGETYVDKHKISGVEVNDRNVSQKIYEQYLEAFRTGVFAFIKEDYDEVTQEVIPRKYFSGGFVGGAVAKVLDKSKTAKRFIPAGDVVTALTHFEPTKAIDRLQRLLKAVSKSGENTLSRDVSPAEAIEFIVGQLNEQGLIEERIDENGNVIVSISEDARFTKLGRALDKWVIHPESGFGTKAINFKSNADSAWAGSWLIIGFRNDLDTPGILEHEQREVFHRKQNPDNDWRVAHNKAVEESDVGELIPLARGGAGIEVFQGPERIASGIGDWIRRKKMSLNRRFLPARNQKLDLSAKDTVRVDTDMTLDYGGLQKWGLERIMIDLVQNHAPADAKGTKVEVTFHLKNGSTLTLHDERVNDLKVRDVKLIEISDDGVGYDYRHLKYFLTTKGSIEEAGKFGEGLKIATAAGILRGMKFEFHSRGWKATPFIETAILNEGHANEMKAEYISFAVTGKGKREGSSTFIKNPNRSVIDTVRKLPELVLLLRKGYKPMAKVKGVGEIVEEGDTVYVKGNRVMAMKNIRGTSYKGLPSLFSYNVFDDTELNRDRDFVPEAVVKNVAESIFLEKVTPEIARKVITAAKAGLLHYETKLVISSDKIKNANKNTLKIWRDVFYELYGKDAILGRKGFYEARDAEEIDSAIKEGRNIVVFERGLLEGRIYNILAQSGIQTTGRLYDGKQLKDKEVDVVTGVSLNYRNKAWGMNRLLLDAVQNHLFADSGATKVSVEFQTDSDWVDLSEIDNYRNRQIRAVRISDNGHGYDYKLLGVFHSTKVSSYQAGQWGEGIKLLSAAALRNGLNIELRSRGWQAKAVEKKKSYQDADENRVSIKVLGYDMVHLANGQIIKGSETIFTNPSRKFLNLVRELPKKALILDKNYQPVSKTDAGEITSTTSPNIYVNGLEVNDEINRHHPLLGYNFIGIEELIASPDRNMLNRDRLEKAIGVMIAQTDSPEAIAVVINKAIGSMADYPEFVDVAKIKNRDVWKAAWDRIVAQRGWDPKKIALLTGRTLSDPDAQILLRNMGYQLIYIKDRISKIIHKFGVHYDREILNPIFEFIDTEQLREPEKKVFALTEVINRKLGEILGVTVKPKKPIRIFTAARSRLTGEEMNGWRGFYNERSRYIGIVRSQLKNPVEFGRTYLEEIAHQISLADDYSREFTNFFRNALLAQIFKEEKIDLAMLDQDNAMNDKNGETKPGGIDLNPVNLDLQVEGNGLDFPLLQDVPELRGIDIQGFTPFIFNITPVNNLPQLLGLSDVDLPVNTTDADSQTTPFELSFVDKYRNKYARGYEYEEINV